MNEDDLFAEPPVFEPAGKCLYCSTGQPQPCTLCVGWIPGIGPVEVPCESGECQRIDEPDVQPPSASEGRDA